MTNKNSAFILLLLGFIVSLTSCSLGTSSEDKNAQIIDSLNRQLMHKWQLVSFEGMEENDTLAVDYQFRNSVEFAKMIAENYISFEDSNRFASREIYVSQTGKWKRKSLNEIIVYLETPSSMKGDSVIVDVLKLTDNKLIISQTSKIGRERKEYLRINN